MADCEHFGRSGGGRFDGDWCVGCRIGLVLAGLLAIGFGVPVKEFSFGNTLMLIGALGVCSGAIMIALWMAIRELKIIGRRLGAGMPEPRGEITVRAVLPPGAVREEAPADSGALFGQPAVPNPGGSRPRQPPPWQDEAAGDHVPEPEPAVEAAAPQNRSAICCSPRPRAKSGSARNRAPASRCRRTCCRRIFAPTLRMRHRRPLHRPSRRRPRSTMRGPSPNAGEPATFRPSRGASNGRRLHRAPMARRRRAAISRR